MGKILLQELGKSTIIPLKEHSILGRSPKADILLSVQSIPNLWLEIRYLQGDWLWNVLNGESETIGAGSYVHHHWRQFTKKIRFNNCITLELIDQKEPEVLIENQQKDFMPLSQFPNIKPYSPTEYQMQDQILQNGQAFVLNNEIYTIWIPGSANNTEETSIMDINDGCLTIDLETLHATFDFGGRHYQITGEAARTLAVYAIASEQASPWINTEEAFLDWLNLGGATDSPPDRINWERNKIIGKLQKQGSFPLTSLFQRRRNGKIWEHKLNFTGEICIST